MMKSIDDILSDSSEFKIGLTEFSKLEISGLVCSKMLSICLFISFFINYFLLIDLIWLSNKFVRKADIAVTKISTTKT